MTKSEEAKFIRCAELLTQYIEKYADKMVEIIESKNESKN